MRKIFYSLILVLSVPTVAFGQSTTFELKNTWPAVPNATSYKLQRSVDAGPYQNAGTTTTTEHKVTLPKDKVYCTQVKATGALGDSVDWSVPCCIDARQIGNVGGVTCTATPLP